MLTGLGAVGCSELNRLGIKTALSRADLLG